MGGDGAGATARERPAAAFATALRMHPRRDRHHLNRLVFALVSAASLMAVSGLVYARTSAAFTASAVSPDSSWSAGAVTISSDRTGSAMFTVADAAPGYSVTQCIQVTYSGTVAAAARLHTAGSGDLADHLTMRVEIGSGGDDDCVGHVPTATLFTGALTQLLTRGSWASGLSGFDPTGPGQAVAYRITASLPADTPNAAQGTTANATFSWEARDRDTAAAPAPLTWYPFDDTNGTVIADASTNRNPANATDVTLSRPPAPGASRAAGTGLGCNGSSTEVAAPQGFTFSRRDPFTISVWVKLDVVDADYRSILERGMFSGSHASFHGVLLGVQADDGFFLSRFDQNPVHDVVLSGPGVQTGVWYHLAVAYDGSALTLYVDGVPADTASATRTVPDVSDHEIYVCSSDDLRLNLMPLDADVDDLYVYNTALTAAQIAVLAS